LSVQRIEAWHMLSASLSLSVHLSVSVTLVSQRLNS